MIRRLARRAALGTVAAALFAVMALMVLDRLYPFPMRRLAEWPVHPVVMDRTGQVLLQRVGSDEQWRQPVALAEMSPWLPAAMIAAEDERFRSHPGVDPIAVGRAVLQNVRSGSVRSGASTLTMQVCRMIDDRPRSLQAKAIEAFRALQLERLKSKDEILAEHLNLAPFGGNLRGVEAAAQAYFGKSARDLSLGEAALLAGLPQAPTRYRPDLRPEEARRRRDYVLRRMVELGAIDESQQAIARAEPIPDHLWPRTRFAPHAAELALARRPQGGRTTIDLELQRDVERLIDEQRVHWPSRADAAVVVIDVTSGDIRAMAGSADSDDPVDGQVNGALARRSPGSALKPFLYAAAFEARELGPESILHDGPISRDGWSPDNFDQTFSGDVTVAEALRRSLNVPAILATERAGLPRCLGLMEAAGILLPADAHRRGGLAVAVGALEVTLLDVTNAYATIARRGMRRPARLFLDEDSSEIRAMDADVCAALDDMLSSRRRDPAGLEAVAPSARPWFSWKTGTSSGRRDAWAVGHNGRFAVGVWVGQFSGQGNAAFVGKEAAEPLLVKLLSLPDLRVDRDPPAYRSWPAIPRSSPVETAALRITAPIEGDEFLLLEREALVPVAAQTPEGTHWFLDGRVMKHSPNELRLLVGSHELRAVDPRGHSVSVRFRVSLP